MSEKEKQTASKIAEAMNKLPEEKREYLIGFAEGVAAMSSKKDDEKTVRCDAS